MVHDVRGEGPFERTGRSIALYTQQALDGRFNAFTWRRAVMGSRGSLDGFRVRKSM